MSFTLYLDRQQWFKHLAETDRLFSGCLPVIKGNGYGFGNSFLADAMTKLGKRSVAVGTLEEARQISSTHSFEQILILTPVWSDLRPADLAFTFTVVSFQHLEQLVARVRNAGAFPPVKVVLKCSSGMKRFGVDAGELKAAAELLRADPTVLLEGYSLHFPVETMTEDEKLRQIQTWIQLISSSGLACDKMYLSHISPALLRRLTEQYPAVSCVVRLGTSLWLAEKAYHFRSTVLAVRQIAAGERYGYKQKKAWRQGYLVSVSGGTANGVGLEAPLHTSGLKGPLKLTLFWFLNLFNFHLSPFVYAGKRLWFAEPPHMQASVLKLRRNPPKPGDEVALKNVRMTIAAFDEIVQFNERAAERDRT